MAGAGAAAVAAGASGLPPVNHPKIFWRIDGSRAASGAAAGTGAGAGTVGAGAGAGCAGVMPLTAGSLRGAAGFKAGSAVSGSGGASIIL